MLPANVACRRIFQFSRPASSSQHWSASQFPAPCVLPVALPAPAISVYGLFPGQLGGQQQHSSSAHISLASHTCSWQFCRHDLWFVLAIYCIEVLHSLSRVWHASFSQFLSWNSVLVLLSQPPCCVELSSGKQKQVSSPNAQGQWPPCPGCLGRLGSWQVDLQMLAF